MASALLEGLEPVTPTEADARLAGVAEQRLRRMVRKGRPLKLRPENGAPGIQESVEIPAAAAALLVRLLRDMARGNAVTIIPIHAELTTQQAADLLGVSRPFVIGLLDQGKLPHKMVGTHRRIRFEDLLAYRRAAEVERDRALGELARDAQEHGLGY